MKYIKINKIYKIKPENILLTFTYNCEEKEIYINHDNFLQIEKALKKGNIKDSLKYWKKYNNYQSSKKYEIDVRILNSILENEYQIKYSLVGKYLMNLELNKKNYIIDFINGNIEICNFIESFDNSKKNKTNNKYNLKVSETISEDDTVNEQKYLTDDDKEEGDDLKSKIENLNKMLPNDFQSLVKFSSDNSEMIKPVIQILNKRTNNLLGELMDKIGLDLNINDKVDSNSEILRISKSLKLIEELNNKDISNLDFNDGEKFNFIISEIWNQIKEIIYSLNKMSPSDNYDNMLKKYQVMLKNVGYNDIIDDKIMKDTLESVLNDSYSKLLDTYFKFMESKYLELNILLQGYDSKKKDNKLTIDKINKILDLNYSLYIGYFNNIYTLDDFYNIFSNYNNDIKFNNSIKNLKNDAQSLLIMKLNDYIKNEVKLNLKFDNEETINKINYNYTNIEEVSINNYYNKYTKIINLSFNDLSEFEKNINKIYFTNVLSIKKKELSSLLLKFHDEIKFKLSIINKIISK